ncbi:accessory Sec system protein Asp2 [Staphylococcus carnosus]|uniref:accessory Sec system protein Asp2 n=1 Tax=Staphylococcus carnosus TaxID=1281 RepID=UPI00081AA31B|nr:accessory Sec system protein Asp2 [Staphylococcus carnosus]ANZ32366.1 accessory Sec system protein Asp2 [Staphylococcus carnosus]UTB79726.1 accessory Sec system protein Asp2 [Staphylococcus carnosus]UTB84493.1 accessory Sec system protein Asp2 [Staphylococcus carnosus]
MARKFRALQIGPINYEEAFESQSEIDWHYINPEEIERDFETLYQEIQAEKAFEFILIQTAFSEKLAALLEILSEPFNTYVESPYWEDKFEQFSAERKYFYRAVIGETKADLIDKIKTIGFSGQYGDKVSTIDALVNPAFTGTMQYNGNVNVELEGDYGEVFTPLIHWKTILTANKNKANDIWPEFEIEGDVELQYTFRVGDNSAVDRILETHTFTQDDLTEPITIQKQPINCYIAVSIKAKGSGKVKIGPVHKRWSRLDFGDFILGGHRFTDAHRNEFIYYFNPGDLKPPLNVYFSGYRPAEGFEAFFMMKKMGAPFLLFGDPRLEGGAFYAGSEEYETAITQTIKDTLAELNFSDRDLIMSGLSMGSFGALYYSGKLKPKAIIVGKLLVNMGTIAANMRLVRPNDFGTMLDILLKNEHSNEEIAIQHLNDKFWKYMKNNDLTDTTFAISYMEHDDYDPRAHDDLVNYFGKQKVKIISRGIPGRHNDDTPTIANWFTNFYNIMLRNEFGR